MGFDRSTSIEVITERAISASNRAFSADRPKAAIGYLEEALAADPDCNEALVAMGDAWKYNGDDLGLDEIEASRRALSYYQRAIDVQPDNAEAYAEISGAYLNLADFESALKATDDALARYEQPWVGNHPPDVWVNIGETIYRMRALALLNLKRPGEGREILDEGLQRFPESWYLTDATKFFLPGGLDVEQR